MVIDFEDTNRNNMAKRKYSNKNNNRPETDVFEKTEEASARLDLKIKKLDDIRKDDIHKQHIRDSNTNHVFKIINQCILIANIKVNSPNIYNILSLCFNK